MEENKIIDNLNFEIDQLINKCIILNKDELTATTRIMLGRNIMLIFQNILKERQADKERIKELEEENKELMKLKENHDIYGVGETRIDLMIEDVIRVIQNLQEENKKYKRMLAEIHAQSLNNSIVEKKKHEEQLEALNEGWKIELEKKDKKIAFLEQINRDLQSDFDKFKKDKDINYLDGIHHKKLVEKSIGQTIDKPEECWFDIFEVQVIKNNMLYGITTNEDFITLKQISDSDPDNCITVIAESPLSGAIYRYNNYSTKEWQLIGTMLGYA